NSTLTTDTTTIFPALDVQGDITLQTGRLELWGGTICAGSCSSNFTIGAGNELVLRGSNYDLSGTITGAGTFWVSDFAIANLTGPYTVTGTTKVDGATLNLSTGSPISVPTLQVVNNATLTGT